MVVHTLIRSLWTPGQPEPHSECSRKPGLHRETRGRKKREKRREKNGERKEIGRGNQAWEEEKQTLWGRR